MVRYKSPVQIEGNVWKLKDLFKLIIKYEDLISIESDQNDLILITLEDAH